MNTILQKIINMLLPPRCIKCDEITQNNHEFCPQCWGKIHFITPPWCTNCGIPFGFSNDDISLCDHCFITPPPFLTGRSAIAYDDFSASIVLKLKHGDATYLAKSMAHFMHKMAGKDFFENCDALIPIPIHWRRLISRRFNQTTLIASHLSYLSGVDYNVNLLKKNRHTDSQETKTRKQRFWNIKKSFKAINKQHIKGKNFILVDDVWTTGATLFEAAQTLIDAGANCVKVITFARVIAIEKSKDLINQNLEPVVEFVPW